MKRRAKPKPKTMREVRDEMTAQLRAEIAGEIETAPRREREQESFYWVDR